MWEHKYGCFVTREALKSKEQYVFYKVQIKRALLLHTSFMKLKWCVFMATLGNAHLELYVLKFIL